MALLARAVTVDAELQEGQHLRTVDFDKPTSRMYLMTLKGSLRDLQRGTASCTWSAARNVHIYQRIAGTDAVSKMPIFEGDPTKGVITDMNLRTLSSNFPVDIGAVITGVHGKVFLDNGKNYAFIAEAGKTYEPTYSIFDPQAPISRAALKEYNEAGMADVDNCIARLNNGWSLVDNLSPIAEMVRINAVDLKVKKFDLPPDVDGWLRLPEHVVDACLTAYKASKKIEFVDFNKFNCVFERIDAEAWDEPIGVIDNMMRKAKGEGGAVDESRLDKVCTLKALVDMNLVLYGPSAGQSPGQ